jgi:hypothetical protein
VGVDFGYLLGEKREKTVWVEIFLPQLFMTEKIIIIIIINGS